MTAITRALEAAAIDPETVRYLEAHGTGTLLGDPIEVEAGSRVYGGNTDKKQYCAIGTVKTNIGHSGSAAGVMGLIKACLALRHGVIPPNIHFETPNPRLQLPDTPFYVPTEARPWVATAHPRRAAVSAFGFGGTNAHIVLEEPPPRSEARQQSDRSVVVMLSARTPVALEATRERLAEHLANHPDFGLHDVAHTLECGRKSFEKRAATVVSGSEELRGRLLAGDVFRGQARESRPVIFAFPGQGSQQPGMGKELYESDSLYREEVDRCADLLVPLLGKDIRTVLHSDSETDKKRLGQTELTQPALFVVEYALARRLMAAGAVPKVMIGHSVSELVAACLAEVFSLSDALKLVALRGRLMQACSPGAMLAVFLSAAETRARLSGELEIAAINAPDISVVSGGSDAVAQFHEELEGEGVASRRLRTSHGFHSISMEPALEPFCDAVSRVKRSAPRIPFISNVTGSLITTAQATDPGYWTEQIRQPVSFARGVETLTAEQGAIWVEVGPGNMLSSLISRQSPEVETVSVMELGPESDHRILAVMAQLWVKGVPVSGNGFVAADKPRKVTLPTYPFENRRFWIDPPIFQDHSDPSPTPFDEMTGTSVVEVTGTEEGLLYVGEWRPNPWRGDVEIDGSEGWLIFEDANSLGELVAEEVRAAGARAISVLAGDRFERLGPDSFMVRPGAKEDLGKLLQEEMESGWTPRRVLHLWQWTGNSGESPVWEDFEKWLDTGHHTLSALVCALDEYGPDHEVHVAVVADGVAAVEGEPPSAEWQKSLLNGVCRVAPREISRLSVQLVDLPASVAAAEEWLIPGILETVIAPEPARLVALRQDGCHLESFGSLPDTNGNIGLRRGGIVFVTGGTGGLGLEVAGRLFEMANMRLALLTRWPIPPVQEWPARAGVNDRIGRALRKVLALQERGAKVLLVQGDAADALDLDRVVGEVNDYFGGIDGVIHAAGVTDPAIVLEGDRQKAHRVLDAKVKGALILERLLAERSLDFFISFSSIASVAPVRGQADYCAANAALDALARRSAPKPWSRVCSIGWDAWQEVGMAARRAESAGPRILPKLDSTPGGEGVDHPLWQRCFRDGDRWLFAGFLSPTEHWVVGEHLIQGTPVLPGTGILEMAYAAFQHLHGGDSPVALENIAFLRLIEVPGEGLEVWLEATPEGEAVHFEMRSRPPGIGELRFEDLTLHTTGTVGPLQSVTNPEAVDVAGEGHRFESAWEPRSQRGPRWACLQESAIEEHMTVSRLRLPQEFHAETEDFRLHPALLDCALGHVHGRRLNGAGVPSTIGHFRIYRRLPPVLTTVVRDIPNSGGAVSIVVTDDQGQVVAEADEYLQVPLREGREEARSGDRSLHVGQVGDLSTLELRPLDLPPPMAGQVQIEVHAAGVNFRDVLTALGAMPAEESAVRSMGSECSGRIVAIGKDISGLAVGDPVAALGPGAFASRMNIASELVVQMPATLSFVQAAAVPMTFLTARYALLSQGRLREGERVLIHSAAGGVGLAAVQIARDVGAQVYATAGSKEKREHLRGLGLEHVMDSRDLGFADEIQEITGGDGVDVVLNSLAGKFIPASLGLLRPFGRFLEIGKRDILENTQLGLLPFRNNLSLHAIDLGQLIAARDPSIREMLGELMEALEQNRFSAGPTLTVPWEKAQQGLQRLTSNVHIGKVVLEVRDSAGRVDGDQAREPSAERGYSWSIPLRQALDIFQELLQRADLPRHVVVSSRPLEAASDGRDAPVFGHKSSAEIERKSSEVYRAPTGPLEERMAEIWQRLLSVAAVGVDDDFFEMGGDSISAIQILSRIRRDFQVGLPPSAVLENPTVAQLSDVVEQRQGKVDEVKA